MFNKKLSHKSQDGRGSDDYIRSLYKHLLKS